MANTGIELKVTTNANLVAKAIEKSGAKVQKAVDEVVVETAGVGLAMVRRNASGPPGPNRRTGDYVRSWGVRYERDR